MNRGATVPVALLAALCLVSLPVHAASVITYQPAPCVELDPSGPSVRVGECNPGGSSGSVFPLSGPSTSSDAPVWANATLLGADVLVEWDHDAAPSTVEAFNVLRGTTPRNLHVATTVDATTTAYRDAGAVLGGDAVWYAVELVYADGGSAVSRPVLVDPW